MTKRQIALKWVRAHPTASAKEAKEAGIAHSAYYLARSILRGKPERSQLGKRARAALEAKSYLQLNLERLTEIVRLLREEGVSEIHVVGQTVEIRTVIAKKWEI